MEIEVLRIGQRVVRDDRVTTHVALVARSFGAQKIYMNEVNPEIKCTISDINKTWGGNFKIEIISEWKKIINVNLNSVFYCCKAVVPHMIKNNYGRIVNIASIAGKEGNPNASAYSASKAGVIGLTKSLGKANLKN